MEIKAVKSAFGWKAENYFPIDSTTRITITTMKRSNGQLATTVTGSRKEGSMWYYTVLQDFAMVYASTPCQRVSKLAVEIQQAQVLKKIETIKFEVIAFYEQLKETT